MSRPIKTLPNKELQTAIKVQKTQYQRNTQEITNILVKVEQLRG